MSEHESKIPPAAPRNRPTPPMQAVQLTEEEKERKRQEIISSAPLQTNPDDATNPPAEDKPKRSKSKVKPWRTGFQDRPASELMQIKNKTSFTQVKEIELRLDYILSETNNNRGLNPKIYMNNLILEALDEYTTRRLKEMGHEVD
ncbi:hypothetical protein WKH82_08435 [Acinetobacter baumannii]|nr:hypothetical protein [Acinetobacter baumannii]